MPTAAGYLAITPSQARTQWGAITTRAWPAEGARQVVFTPVETLLCLAASLMVNHRRYRDAGQCFGLQAGGEGPRWEGRQARAVP